MLTYWRIAIVAVVTSVALASEYVEHYSVLQMGVTSTM
jgi:hypothetical protein